MSLSFHYTIDKINQHIQSFEFYKTRDKLEITINTYKSISGEYIKVVYCMDNNNNNNNNHNHKCYKDFGWYYSPILNHNTLFMCIDNLPLEIDNYIGKTIETINVYKIPSDKSEYGGSIVMEINLENNKTCNFVMYNFHNDKCSHDILLNIYENGDIKPMKILKTYL